MQDENDISQETASVEAGSGEQTQEFGAQETQDESAIPGVDQIAAQQQASTPEQQTFLEGSTLDPRQLPPEIQPIWKRMQSAYTKKMQEIAAVRDQAQLVERFHSDRDYAFQTVAQWAAQNGFAIQPVGAQAHQQAQLSPQQQQAQGDVPPALIEQVKQSLPPELQWMAESQAKAQWAAAQMLLKPLVQQTQQQQRQVVEQEWDKLAGELSEEAPGWEQHESEMTELYDFLQGQKLSHPKFGSKHKLLYNLVTSNAAATAQVAKRMTQAAKNRPSSGITTGKTASNLLDRVRQAKTSQDAFRLAAQAAGGFGE